MPQGKPRSKEDTWREEDLKKSLKSVNDERKKNKNRDGEKKREKTQELNNDEKERRKKKDEDREKRHKEKSDVRGKDEKKRSHHREDEDDEERRRRREERKKKQENEDDEERRKRREERKKKHENEDDEERRRRREERKRREEEEGGEKRHRRRDEDDGKEKRRHHRDREGDDEERKKRHRDREGEDRKHRKKDEKRDDDSRRRHRDRDKENDEERHKRHRDKENDDGRRHHRRDDEDRERRHRRRDEEGSERRHRKDETGEDKTKSSHDATVVKKESNLQNGDAAEDDYNYDDEEFEDYDDDFEDESEGDQEESSETSSRQGSKAPSSWDLNDPDPEKREMAEVLKAMNEENTRILSASSRTYSDEEDEPRYTRQQQQQSRNHGGRAFINFVSAKQRQMTQKAASKAKERSKEILKLVDLDVAAYDMFDLAPVREYDRYIMNFGRSNTKQAYVQTNEDNMDREIQTEEIDRRTKWCQHPAEEYVACGGVDGEGIEEEDMKKKEADSSRLGMFIQKAGQVIAILLEEELVHKDQRDLGGNQSDISLSDNYVQLTTPPFLNGRHVIHSCFSPVQSYLLLTVFTMPSKSSSSKKWTKYGIVCVWNVNEPSRPQKVLTCSGQPVCACFSPKKATLVFAGMRDGSVVVWDLREASSLHQTMTIEREEWLFRHPTYSTAGLSSFESHHSACVSVRPIISPTESAKSSLLDPNKKDSDIGSGLSFQLASLEESAVLHVWVVAEISNADIAGSESDLGLSPGGKIKLLLSSSIHLENPVRDPSLKSSLHAFDMQLLPSDPNHFYVGTDSGFVVHGVRHTGRAPPKAFRPEFESPVDIVSIDFSPFDQPVFLVGCRDGSVRLHNAHFEHPLISWPNATGGSPIRCVLWSRSRPSVFYIIDGASLIHVFDIIQNDAAPILSERISKSRVTSLCLSNDHSATGLGLPGRQPQMVKTSEDGSIEVHNISQQYAMAQLDEVYQFVSYLERSV